MLALPLEVCAAFFDAEASTDTLASLFILPWEWLMVLGCPHLWSMSSPSPSSRRRRRSPRHLPPPHQHFVAPPVYSRYRNLFGAVSFVGVAALLFFGFVGAAEVTGASTSGSSMSFSSISHEGPYPLPNHNRTFHRQTSRLWDLPNQ